MLDEYPSHFEADNGRVTQWSRVPLLRSGSRGSKSLLAYCDRRTMVVCCAVNALSWVRFPSVTPYVLDAF